MYVYRNSMLHAYLYLRFALRVPPHHYYLKVSMGTNKTFKYLFLKVFCNLLQFMSISFGEGC